MSLSFSLYLSLSGTKLPGTVAIELDGSIVGRGRQLGCERMECHAADDVSVLAGYLGHLATGAHIHDSRGPVLRPRGYVSQTGTHGGLHGLSAVHMGAVSRHALRSPAASHKVTYHQHMHVCI